MSEPTRHEHALRQMLKMTNLQIGEMRAEADARDKKFAELRGTLRGLIGYAETVRFDHRVIISDCVMMAQTEIWCDGLIEAVETAKEE